jgi:hypothetical protein
MVDGGMDNGRESGTGRDTPTVCVHVPHRFPMPFAGHSVTMSRPVPLSRTEYPVWQALAVPALPALRMSGRRSRSKDARTERSITKALKANRVAAVRIPLSGSVGGRFAGDIVLQLMGRDLCVELKDRADGFRNRDVLIVKADRQESLVVLRLTSAAQIAKADNDAPSPRSDNSGRRSPHYPRSEAGWRVGGRGENRRAVGDRKAVHTADEGP